MGADTNRDSIQDIGGHTISIPNQDENENSSGEEDSRRCEICRYRIDQDAAYRGDDGVDIEVGGGRGVSSLHGESKRGKLWACLEVRLGVYIQRWGGLGGEIEENGQLFQVYVMVATRN